MDASKDNVINKENIVLSKRDNTFNVVVGVICAITNLSQLPIFVDNGFSSLLSTVVWIFFLLYLLFRDGLSLKLKIREIGPYIILFIYFLFYSFVLQAFTGKNYYRTSLFSSFFLSAFVLIVGFVAGGANNKKTIDVFATCYIITSAIVGVVVFFQFILGYDITSRIYAYDSKNSTSQIVLTGIIFILAFKINEKRQLLRIIYIITAAFLTYVVLLMKSRATIIAIPVIVLLTMWLGKFNKRAAIIVTVGVVAVIVFLLLKPSIWESLYNNIILGGRESGDLDDITSGRTHEWEAFFPQFAESPFFGHGVMKRESVILTALLEYGFLGGVPIIIYAVSPLFFAATKLDLKTMGAQSFLLIAVTYIINGIFEQLAPFGPGVKCYALWFMMGLFISSHMYDKKQIKRSLLWDRER